MSHPELQPILAARELYPGAPVRPYLNVAVRSLLARPVREVCDWYLDGAMEGGPNKDVLFDTVERGRARFARWIGADPDEVAWTRNVTDGMNLFLTALDWRVAVRTPRGFCPDYSEGPPGSLCQACLDRGCCRAIEPRAWRAFERVVDWLARP